LGLKSDLDDQKNIRESLEKSLCEAKEEISTLTQQYEEKEKEIAGLQHEIQQLRDENQKFSEELTALTNHKFELETTSISRKDYDELEEKLQSVSGLFCSLFRESNLLSNSIGERNHFQQMTQSLGKELKRVLKSSQQEVQELSSDLESQKEKYEVRESLHHGLTHTANSMWS
jgi:chromosome segregation ATPase